MFCPFYCYTAFTSAFCLFWFGFVMCSSSVVGLSLNRQVVGNFLLFNISSVDLAHSCEVLETASVSSFFFPNLFI